MKRKLSLIILSIDVEYIAFCDELDDAIASNGDRESITFVNSASGSEEIPTASAE